MITVHHLEYSQSFRVLWLFEELGAEYELKVYDRDPETRLAPEEYKAISPLGTAPVITDKDVALSETAAIVDYVLDRFPDTSLRPAMDSPSRARYLFWFHASQGSLMPILLMETIFNMLKTRSPRLLKPLLSSVFAKASGAFSKPRLNKILLQAEKDLAGNDWFAGDQFSAADIMMSYPMQAAQSKGLLNEDLPNCLAWIERIKAMKSFQSAQEKDGRASIIFTA